MPKPNYKTLYEDQVEQRESLERELDSLEREIAILKKRQKAPRCQGCRKNIEKGYCVRCHTRGRRHTPLEARCSRCRKSFLHENIGRTPLVCPECRPAWKKKQRKLASDRYRANVARDPVAHAEYLSQRRRAIDMTGDKSKPRVFKRRMK